MKFAIWFDEKYGDILFQFDDEGNFEDITDEGIAILVSAGEEPYEWLSRQEYPLKWEEYTCRGTDKTEFEPCFPIVHEFRINGIESREFTVRSGSNSSARINVPADWQGKKVMVVRLE